MNIVLLTTYRHGGAGVACRRLQAALQGAGHTANLLTAGDMPWKWPFYAERLSFLPFEKDKSVRFAFSLANFGHDLSRHPLVQAADILHLHWINQGFLSLENIRQLGKLGKPLVWTLHDMWAFTGGCHHNKSGTCLHFQQICGQCPFVRRPGPNDLSHRIWARKKALFPQQIQFITCSDWLAGEARKSSLLKDYPIQTIPNAIDTEVFKPLPEAERQRFRQEKGWSAGAFILVFAAMKVKEPTKGFSYLLEALRQLKSAHPDLPIEIAVLGKSDPEALAALPYPYHALGLVSDVREIAAVYGAADAFITPSMEDNLPNTVMEALACGTPVIGFRTGGIPEMVSDGVEGYITDRGDSAAMAQGIYRMASGTAPLGQMRKAARQKVERAYANPVVARRHLDVYAQLLG